jgi:hypothetical protein
MNNNLTLKVKILGLSAFKVDADLANIAFGSFESLLI